MSVAIGMALTQKWSDGNKKETYEDGEDELEEPGVVVEEDSEGCWGVEVGSLGVEEDSEDGEGEGLGEGLGMFVSGLGEATGGDVLGCGSSVTVTGTGVGVVVLLLTSWRLCNHCRFSSTS